MDFLVAHRLSLGLAADAITLIGALVLTTEAFGRLRDLAGNRLQKKFDELYPDLPLVDQEAAAAKRIVRLAYLGCLLMILGFVLQALTRVVESHADHPAVNTSKQSDTPQARIAVPSSTHLPLFRLAENPPNG
jgi:hypothetical protein